MEQQQREGRDLTATRQRVVVDPPDAQETVAELVRVGFGLVAVGLGVALRTLEPSSAAPTRTRRGQAVSTTEIADVVVGTAWGAARVTGRLAATGSRAVRPVVSVMLRPPLVPRGLQPGRGVARLAEQWRRDRPETVRSLAQWSASTVPSGIQAGLRQLDVQACVDAVLDAVDLDAVVAGVVRRMDVDAAATLVLGRMDLGAVSSAALDQLDLTQLVLDRVDLERVVAGVLDRLDLTTLAIDRVDLGRVVDAALQQVDLTQVVVDQVDLIAVAEYVVAGIDLPEIIRASTGSMASETVRGLRMQGVGADQAITRAVDRVLFRRGQRRSVAAGVPQQGPRGDDDTEERP